MCSLLMVKSVRHAEKNALSPSNVLKLPNSAVEASILLLSSIQKIDQVGNP
jgi:hypothetical protein